MNKHDKPSAFHEAQRVIWKAQLRAEHKLADAKLEVEIMEYREMRDDPESTIEAVNLIQRIRRVG